MTEELNIRAAKALGWKLREDKPMAWRVWYDLNGKTLLKDNLFVFDVEEHYGYYRPLTDRDTLNFTTSYDWAMLGVNSLDHSQLLSYVFKLIGQLTQEIDIDELFKASDIMHIYLLLKKSPLSMTQAWVEVLEEESNE